MEVRVDTYVEKLNGTRYPVNRAYLTLVAVDETGKPTKVPGLLIESIGQQAEWEAGQKRKKSFASNEIRKDFNPSLFSSPVSVHSSLFASRR